MSDPNKYTDMYLKDDDEPLLDRTDYAQSSYSEKEEINMGTVVVTDDGAFVRIDDESNLYGGDSGDYTA